MGPVSIQLPTPDWSAIIPQIVPLFFAAIATYLQQLAQQVLDGLAGSGTNILTRTPPEWTYQLGPLRSLSSSGTDAIYGVISLALVLAGFSLIGRQYFGWSWTLGQHAARIGLAIIFCTGCLRLIGWSIDAVNNVDGAIGAASVPAPPDMGALNPLVSVVLLICWIVLLGRLARRRSATCARAISANLASRSSPTTAPRGPTRSARAGRTPSGPQPTSMARQPGRTAKRSSSHAASCSKPVVCASRRCCSVSVPPRT
jgi:hypothetical protein